MNSSLISFTFQSTADVPLLMTIFSSRVGFCNKVTDTTSALVKVVLIIICVQVMWIMDKVFKFTNFGVVSWMHDDFFILAGRDHRDTSLVHLKRHLSEVRSLLKWPYTKQTILISGVHPQAEEVFSGVS